MALKKSIKVNGWNITADYWKIVQVNIDYLNKQSHVVLALYLSQEDRTNGDKPLPESRSFDWSGDEFPFDLAVLSEEGENSVKVAYEKIKESKLNDEDVETNFFADAEDC